MILGGTTSSVVAEDVAIAEAAEAATAEAEAEEVAAAAEEAEPIRFVNDGAVCAPPPHAAPSAAAARRPAAATRSAVPSTAPSAAAAAAAVARPGSARRGAPPGECETAGYRSFKTPANHTKPAAEAAPLVTPANGMGLKRAGSAGSGAKPRPSGGGVSHALLRPAAEQARGRGAAGTRGDLRLN